MPSGVDDRRLRRLVDDLASLRKEDVASILDQLNGAERTTIDALLLEHGGASVGSIAQNDAFDERRFSPWLVERINDASGSSITTHARRVLRDCAASLHPGVQQQPRPNKSGLRSLLGTRVNR
jgi:hypothetical protein